MKIKILTTKPENDGILDATNLEVFVNDEKTTDMVELTIRIDSATHFVTANGFLLEDLEVIPKTVESDSHEASPPVHLAPRSRHLLPHNLLNNNPALLLHAVLECVGVPVVIPSVTIDRLFHDRRHASVTRIEFDPQDNSYWMAASAAEEG